MRKSISISVITPSYNQGSFLSETIESVLRQEGDFHLQYIIVDGGSSDQSVEIIRRYEKKLNERAWPVKCRSISFQWLSEKDGGQSDALIKGFGRAEGSVLAWLNSDDSYLPGAVAAAAHCFSNFPDTALFYGDAHYCDAAGTVIGNYRTEPFHLKKLPSFNFICQPSTFFTRKAFDAVGGLDRSLRFAMDYDLWIKLALRFPCHYLPQVLSVYRLHDSSKTMLDETLYENSEEALQLALKYFQWAPLTRVYNSCNFYCKSRLPRPLSRMKLPVLAATIACSILRSLRLNHGVSSRDIALLLDRENFRKLFKSRLEIMTGREGSNSKGSADRPS
jgi:glycosyltransferase involved in cell wall biosynthesis